jgi:large subunit ribosomal protein L6|tara:strand:+ start:182 stop:715 length:534 start_codon:yes stop_codon:yes gene_type:complete
MSRIANAPITVPSAVEVQINGQNVTVKGKNGTLDQQIHELVGVVLEDGELKVKARNETKPARALSGTSRALLQNMVQGVSEGFERRLTIVGVGYRAQINGKKLNLSLGHSHPIDFDIPEDVTIEAPSQTEVVVKGIDKQRVGQVAANIRAFRKPEPYKGKGVKYSDEVIVRKEAKKS